MTHTTTARLAAFSTVAWPRHQRPAAVERVPELPGFWHSNTSHPNACANPGAPYRGWNPMGHMSALGCPSLGPFCRRVKNPQASRKTVSAQPRQPGLFAPTKRARATEKICPQFPRRPGNSPPPRRVGSSSGTHLPPTEQRPSLGRISRTGSCAGAGLHLPEPLLPHTQPTQRTHQFHRLPCTCPCTRPTNCRGAPARSTVDPGRANRIGLPTRQAKSLHPRGWGWAEGTFFFQSFFSSGPAFRIWSASFFPFDSLSLPLWTRCRVE